MFLGLFFFLPPADTPFFSSPPSYNLLHSDRLPVLRFPICIISPIILSFLGEINNLTNQLEGNMEMEEAVNAFSRPDGGLFQSLPLLKCCVVLVIVGSIRGSCLSIFLRSPWRLLISRLFVLPALVLVASGLKRATCALWSLGISPFSLLNTGGGRGSRS